MAVCNCPKAARVSCRIAIDAGKHSPSEKPVDVTNNPYQADELSFYKIEKWTKDGSKVVACCTPAEV